MSETAAGPTFAALLARLNDRQRAFVREYLVDLNATQAAIRAGYSERTSAQIGRQLLQKTSVAAAIAAAQARRAKRVDLRADRVLRELACLALSDIGEVLDFSGDAVRLRPAHQIPTRARRAIASMKVKRYPDRVGTDDDGKPLFETCEVVEFKLYDKNSALDKALRHLGIAEKPDTSGDPQTGDTGVLRTPAPVSAPEWCAVAQAQQDALRAETRDAA